MKAKGEGRNCELAECAMRRGVSVRAYEGAEEETANGWVGKEHTSFPQKMGRKKRKEGAFRKEQGAFLSVMLIAYRESPPTKGSSPLLERVFVVLKITLTRSKNAPNHQINKQKNNRKGGNLKRPPLC